MPSLTPSTTNQARENLKKIDHFVVLMLENRSFDQMLGHLELEGHDIDGVKPASFPDKLKQTGLPNIVFRAGGGNSGREVAEIDVPMRVGSVLVAVQTWARDVDKRMDGGDHAALKERWRAVRRKLKTTDEHYARGLIADPESRRYLKRKGIRFVLPVFCSPFAEPVASTDPKYWIRHPSQLPPNVLPASLARIVTPPELGPFLNQTTEGELRRICEREGWRL